MIEIKSVFHSNCFYIIWTEEAVEMKTNSGGGRCMTLMDPRACELSSCKQKCLQHKNGNGVCLRNFKVGYQCACYINCLSTWIMSSREVGGSFLLLTQCRCTRREKEISISFSHFLHFLTFFYWIFSISCF